MPDFEAMTDQELRQFKSAKNAELIATRELIREAGRVLERKRAEADHAWVEEVRSNQGADAVAEAVSIVAPPAAADSKSDTGKDGVSSR